MDINFTDLSEAPLPPEEVRLRELRAAPSPDRQHLRVYIETDPSQKRPNIDLALVDDQGSTVVTTAIIHSMSQKMELTLHLRGAGPGHFTLTAVLYFSSLLDEPTPEISDGPIERLDVDQKSIEIEV